MIERVIHYCWFGGKALPKEARRCIASWQRFFPGWEIRRHDESNFDVAANSFVAEAYRAGKYAFVSDYARFQILERYGGIYFDVDVEVVAPFDDILSRGAFMGFEIDAVNRDDYPGRAVVVNPGLGMGFPAGHPFVREMLGIYDVQSFDAACPTTVVELCTECLRRHGLKEGREIENVCDTNIYPHDYFCPMDNDAGTFRPTANTHSIHSYAASWVPLSLWQRFKHNLRRRKLLFFNP